jgi:hypothetical protein
MKERKVVHLKVVRIEKGKEEQQRARDEQLKKYYGKIQSQTAGGHQN